MAEFVVLPVRKNLNGVLDAKIPPILMVRSGDNIHFTTLEPDWRMKKPVGTPLQSEYFPRKKGDDDGHALCGPVYVEGAAPGKSLKIEIGHIITDNWGWSSVGIGNEEHKERLGFHGEKYFTLWELCMEKRTCTNGKGIEVGMNPFPGVLAVAPEGNEKVSTHLPGNYGGNLDCRELTQGAIVYLPIYHDGALFFIGDGHAAQGDGESGGTAIECPFKKIDITLSVDDFMIQSPVVHNKRGWITFGFHEDLTEAAYQALKNMRLFLKKRFGMDEMEAMTLCSVAVDLHITQIVNGVRGVHAILTNTVYDKL